MMGIMAVGAVVALALGLTWVVRRSGSPRGIGAFRSSGTETMLLHGSDDHDTDGGDGDAGAGDAGGGDGGGGDGGRST